MNKLFIAALLLAGTAAAQTKLDKSIPVKPGQSVRITFDYPKLIKISTWDKNEISIQGSVNINDGENDDAFVIDTHSSGNVMDIRGKVKDMDDLPQRITIVKDGVKTVFRSEAEYKKYKKEKGLSNFDLMNRGLDLEITLEIKVPARTQTSVVSVYGMVEVNQFDGPLAVEAMYGGVDATLAESSIGDLVAETNYGHIYSDLNLRSTQDQVREEDFHTVISAKLGKGPGYRFESPYGNVYLRRTK